VHSLRASCHDFLQLLPKPALPEVSDRGPGTLDRRTTRYVHVVFTLPHQLVALTLQNKKVIHDLLFRTSAETLLEVARDPRHLGPEVGFFSVLASAATTVGFVQTAVPKARQNSLLPLAPR
jgi:hypothetical protein